jgi:hypothetical protein
MRLGNGKGVRGLDEEKVVGHKREYRRKQSGPDAEPSGRENHGQQKNH